MKKNVLYFFIYLKSKIMYGLKLLKPPFKLLGTYTKITIFKFNVITYLHTCLTSNPIREG